MLTGAGVGHITQAYLYNAAGPHKGRLCRETTTGADGFAAPIGYSYDAWGNVAQVQYPSAVPGAFGRTVGYANDVFGRAETVSVDSAPLAALTYDPLGRGQTLSFASGASNTYTHDLAGNRPDRLSSWGFSPVGAPGVTNSFSYDANGHLSNTGQWAVENDGLGRIVGAEGFGVMTRHGHDAFGNNTLHDAAPSPASPSSYPPNTMVNWDLGPLADNRVPPGTLSNALTWWQYADNGEAARVGTAPGGDSMQLAWDGLGMLRAVSESSGGMAKSAVYDHAPSGMRVGEAGAWPAAKMHYMFYWI